MKEMGVGLRIKDQHVTKLKWDFEEVKATVEQSYNLGFVQVLEKAKYIFIGQELNFALLDLSKDMDEIMAEANQNAAPNQAQAIVD